MISDNVTSWICYMFLYLKGQQVGIMQFPQLHLTLTMGKMHLLLVLYLKAQQVGIILVHLQLLIVEELDCLIVQQHVHSLTRRQIVQLIHLLSHFCGSLQSATGLSHCLIIW